MMKCACFLLWWPVLLISTSAFAENRAVNISIGSIGGPLDDAALQTVRRVIGHAVASSTADIFIVYSPRVGSPIPIEGGLSACVEAGFNTTKTRFNAFVQELLSIHPKRGTSYNVERTATCSRGEDAQPIVGPLGLVFCTQDAKSCPDGSFVGRVPPSCEFARCPQVER